jgi:hypothetical protein
MYPVIEEESTCDGVIGWQAERHPYPSAATFEFVATVSGALDTVEPLLSKE